MLFLIIWPVRHAGIGLRKAFSDFTKGCSFHILLFFFLTVFAPGIVCLFACLSPTHTRTFMCACVWVWICAHAPAITCRCSIYVFYTKIKTHFTPPESLIARSCIDRLPTLILRRVTVCADVTGNNYYSHSVLWLEYILCRAVGIAVKLITSDTLIHVIW